MSLRFFCAPAECGEVCMGRLGLVGRLGLMGSEKDLVRAALARSAGSGDPRRARHRSSPLLTSHSSHPTPHFLSVSPVSLCLSLFFFPTKNRAGQPAAVVDLRDLNGVSSRLPNCELTPLSCRVVSKWADGAGFPVDVHRLSRWLRRLLHLGIGKCFRNVFQIILLDILFANGRFQIGVGTRSAAGFVRVGENRAHASVDGVGALHDAWERRIVIVVWAAAGGATAQS